jgi:hypothetical protein
VRRANIAAAAQTNLAQHRRWQETHPAATATGRASTGTAPRRTAPETWHTRPTKQNPQGTLLNPLQSKYWEALYHAGYVSGRGKLLHPIPRGWRPGGPPATGSRKTSVFGSAGTTTSQTQKAWAGRS